MRFRFEVSFFVLAIPLCAQAQITQSSGGGERQPVVSGDARTVAYGAMVGSSRELFTVASDGGTRTQRTNNAKVIFDFGTFGNWPSLSISLDGTKITYWNAGGVHVVDTVANTDTVVAASAVASAFPCVEPTGSFVVYQDLVQGNFEVYRVAATGGTSTKLSGTSGAGNRHPHAVGNWVIWQDLVAGYFELFAHDLQTSQTRQITANSGGGNRYGKLSPDGKLVAYEAVSSGFLEVHVVDPAIGQTSVRRITNLASGGARMPTPTQDGSVFFQAAGTGGGLEVFAAETNGTSTFAVTAHGGPVTRRPTCDAHGHVVVYQALVGNEFEVFRLRSCSTPTFSAYGVHGTPSVGSLQSVRELYRCNAVLALGTSLPASTNGWFLLGATSYPAGIPIPGAPGNFVYTSTDVAVPTLVTGGFLSISIPLPSNVAGSVYAQWGLLDPPANGLGLVTSEATTIRF